MSFNKSLVVWPTFLFFFLCLVSHVLVRGHSTNSSYDLNVHTHTMGFLWFCNIFAYQASTIIIKKEGLGTRLLWVYLFVGSKVKRMMLMQINDIQNLNLYEWGGGGLASLAN